MSLVRPMSVAVAATALIVTAAFACGDKSKTSATAAASSDMPACCASKSAAATKSASAESCTPAQKAACSAMKSTKGVKTASSDQCMFSKSASMASSCAGHGKTSATMAAGNASCSSQGRNTAAMAAGSGSCSGHAMLGGMAMAHGDCGACDDMAFCDEQLVAAGARMQVVPLKNGVMYVYTSDTPQRVRAVQAAVAQRNQRVTSLLTSADKTKICRSCKDVRGAMASGKMNREVVNVESGALTLVTSNDKAMVGRILEAANGTVAVQTGH